MCRCFFVADSDCGRDGEDSAYVDDARRSSRCSGRTRGSRWIASGCSTGDQIEFRAIMRADSSCRIRSQSCGSRSSSCKADAGPGSDEIHQPCLTWSLYEQSDSWLVRTALVATPSREMMTLFSGGPTESGVTVSPETRPGPGGLCCVSGAQPGYRAGDDKLRRKTGDAVPSMRSTIRSMRCSGACQSRNHGLHFQAPTMWTCSPMARLCRDCAQDGRMTAYGGSPVRIYGRSGREQRGNAGLRRDTFGSSMRARRRFSKCRI